MSSTYKNEFENISGLSVTILLMCRMKRRGPRIEPCGTRDRTGRGHDRLLPTLTD